MTTSSVACPSCTPGGRPGVVMNSKGQAQVCPNCGGTGAKSPAVIRVPFDYAFPSAVLTANQQGFQNPLVFDYDADFEQVWWTASSTGLYSVQITDRSANRQLSNAPVNGENFAGTAQVPFPLVEPYVWARSSAALGVFNDRSGAGNTVQLVMRGYKLYPASAPQQGSQGVIVQSGT
jgi:hypothetical protein